MIYFTSMSPDIIRTHLPPIHVPAEVVVLSPKGRKNLVKILVNKPVDAAVAALLEEIDNTVGIVRSVCGDRPKVIYGERVRVDGRHSRIVEHRKRLVKIPRDATIAVWYPGRSLARKVPTP